MKKDESFGENVKWILFIVLIGGEDVNIFKKICYVFERPNGAIVNVDYASLLCVVN